MDQRTAQEAQEAQRLADRRQRLDRLAWFMDESIRLPGGFRVGLDSLIGLVPGIGDGMGALTSSYVLVEAHRAGASVSVLARMVLNVLIEAVVGVIPILGDVFDMVWKSNRRNVDLLQRHLQRPKQTQRVSRGYLVLGVLAILGIFGLMFVVVVFIARFLFDLF